MPICKYCDLKWEEDKGPNLTVVCEIKVGSGLPNVVEERRGYYLCNWCLTTGKSLLERGTPEQEAKNEWLETEAFGQWLAMPKFKKMKELKAELDEIIEDNARTRKRKRGDEPDEPSQFPLSPPKRQRVEGPVPVTVINLDD
jgi:hypothetical protein